MFCQTLDRQILSSVKIDSNKKSKTKPKHQSSIYYKSGESLCRQCSRMARPIPDLDLRDLSKLDEGDIKPTPASSRTYFDSAIDKISKNKSSRNLICGTLSGWLAGVTVIKVGKIAAFGLGGGVLLLHFASEYGYIHVNWERVRESADRSQAWMERVLSIMKRNSCFSVGFIGGFFFVRASLPAPPLTTTITEPPERPPIPPDPIAPAPPIAPLPKPVEPFKPTEEPNPFLDKPNFLTQPKPISHSPKISPSSIPNPSPSVTATKQPEPGYPPYNNYLYSIPGYSAFQPVSFPPPPGVIPPNQAPIAQNETSTGTATGSSDFVPFPKISVKETPTEEKSNTEVYTITETQPSQSQGDVAKPQTDFEDQFTPEIIPAASVSETTPKSECKMSITSLTQGSGATVTIPTQVPNKDAKIKAPERFSLKTSIPISKLDLKCVNTTPDPIFTNAVPKKFSTCQPFQNQKPDESRVEIQSNIIIKTAPDNEHKEMIPNTPNNSISTLINAAEAINKTEAQFKKPENKPEILNDSKDTTTSVTTQPSNVIQRPIFNPINVESHKPNFANKPPDGSFNEQKNQILFIQNKTSNPKMLLTIQQQNPQVLLQRTNFDSKNLQAPSRLSNQNKKCKEEVANDSGTSSKVVALKRLHQENCDENDFENLITENQIYGNKIVVKEKSQGTLQEQDLKNKAKIDKPIQNETKNVVVQPNFLYLSNVQFPANLMMIKNKVPQNNDVTKTTKTTSNENKVSEESITTNNVDLNTTVKNLSKPQNVAASKEIHVLKSSNNVLQTLSNKNNKTDIVFQTTNQKVIMNPQIVYQVPMIVDSDNKLNQPFINMDYSKFVSPNKKDFPKPFDQSKPSDKLFIACPYQMDSKLQPKIVITNIRPKLSKIEEVSSLDIYEKRKRLRRLKYLSTRDSKEQKSDVKKSQEKEKTDNRKNIITPEKMTAEIYKEFANTKITVDEGVSESDSDYGEDELKEYNSIINEYRDKTDEDNGKVEFMSGLRLATLETYKEKELERQEKILRWDSVASAYIAAGRLDKIMPEEPAPEAPILRQALTPANTKGCPEKTLDPENGVNLQRKQIFLTQLKLIQVSPQRKEGYEKIWQAILKDRRRREGNVEHDIWTKQPRQDVDLDTNGQLRILTEIKKYVNENNNLIKKKLDSNSNGLEGDSIRVLAEKNFSELNRLSKMADRSVKLFSGQETRKRDLNPGFDSENIQKSHFKPDDKNYPSINIPNISKIISLKTTQEQSTVISTQATSMDEPQSSAAGLKMFRDGKVQQDFSCQVEETMPWPGLDAIMRSYKEFDAARRKEISELHRRNTSLRVECAHVTRAASRDSDRARALLAERQHLAHEEASLRASVQRLCAAVDAIRNC